MAEVRAKRLPHFALMSAFIACLCIDGCSTTEMPAGPPAPEPPPSTRLPHPAGTSISDLLDLFRGKSAPALDTEKKCDAPFRKLAESTSSRQELVAGARELL